MLKEHAQPSGTYICSGFTFLRMTLDLVLLLLPSSHSIFGHAQDALHGSRLGTVGNALLLIVAA